VMWLGRPNPLTCAGLDHFVQKVRGFSSGLFSSI
jgi:hypothetical protein